MCSGAMTTCVSHASGEFAGLSRIWNLQKGPRQTILSRSSRLLCNLRCQCQHSTRSSVSQGTKSSATGPLKGVKIVDLTRVLAGPFCTQILADYGADVIKVEHPVGGDDTRSWRTAGEDQFWKGRKDLSVYFSGINRNKRSITLNLKHQKGREILFRLVKDADVVVDNFVPGKMDEMGIGYERLSRDNPGLIHASISGYGAGGPYKKRAGYDAILAAEAGLMYITGERDGKPMKPGLGLIDMATGLFLHGAILAALVNRERTGGRGQKIDASLFETQVSLLTNVGMSWLNLGLEAQRWGTEHPSIVPYDMFETADSVLVLGATNNRQFKILCERLGAGDLADDPRFVDNPARVKNRKALKKILNDLFASKRTEEWLTVFEGSGMPYGPVNNIQQVFEHPQTKARNMVETLEHEASDSGQIKMLGIPVKFSESKASIRTASPILGQHNDEVFQELGLDATEIEQLRQEKII